MRYLGICLLIGIFSFEAFGASLKMKEEDQRKLAELVAKLPLTVRRREVQRISDPTTGTKVRSEIPKYDSPVKIICESYYFNDSEYASFANCKIDVDKTRPEIEIKNNEVKIEITEPMLVSALFNDISYEKNVRETRSWGREWTTNFDGEVGYVFDYYFTCTLDHCRLKLSSTNLQ